MRSSWYGTLTFGLVSVPVGIAVSQDRQGVSFRQLHRGCGERVRMPKVCPVHGELKSDDIVRGYEFDKDQYIEIEDSEIEDLRPDPNRTIAIDTFVKLDLIDPILFDRTYYLVPAKEPNARDGYRLLVEAMERTGMAAIASFVLWQRENLCTVRSHEGRLLMDLLFYAEDIRDGSPIDDMLEDVTVSDAEVALAVQIVESKSTTFDHGTYKSGYREQLKNMLEAKARGKAAPKRRTKTAAAKQPADLMAALKASLDEASNGKPKPRRKAAVKVK